MGVIVEVAAGRRMRAAIPDLAHSRSRPDRLADADARVYFVEVGVDRHHMAEEWKDAVVDDHKVPVERQERERGRCLEFASDLQQLISVVGVGILVVAHGQNHPTVERSNRMTTQREAPEVHPLMNPESVGPGGVGEKIRVGERRHAVAGIIRMGCQGGGYC